MKLTRKVEEAQEQLEKMLSTINDVTSISIGEAGGKPRLKVGVKKITPHVRDLIPTQIQGYDVEIEETGEIKAIDAGTDQ